MPNEADTCRRYIVPRLQAAGWDNDPHRINEQVMFTDGRIIVAGRTGRRRPGKRADYILRYRPDLPIAVVEAKPTYATPGAGLQQAKDNAEILGVKFAFATNGHGILEFDYLTGLEREPDEFPTPAELWARLAISSVADQIARQQCGVVVDHDVVNQHATAVEGFVCRPPE
jgi:type I restriction enzyme, R subunit